MKKGGRKNEKKRRKNQKHDVTEQSVVDVRFLPVQLVRCLHENLLRDVSILFCVLVCQEAGTATRSAPVCSVNLSQPSTFF